MLEAVLEFFVHMVEVLGYPGLFVMTMLESTFLPIPSERTRIPAGYLIYRGEMHFIPAFILSVAGSLAGALVNYAIAIHYGRKLLLRHGKLFMMDEEKLDRMESFFRKHGPVSIFLGRLVFGIRHYISFPAGLAKMDMRLFLLYTAAGAAIWVAVLLGLGYFIGGNEERLHSLLPQIKGVFLLAVAGIALLYVRHHRKKGGWSGEGNHIKTLTD